MTSLMKKIILCVLVVSLVIQENTSAGIFKKLVKIVTAPVRVVVDVVKETGEILEEVAEEVGEIIQGSHDAVGETIQIVAKTGSATGHFLIGDQEKAKDALRDIENNAEELSSDVGGVIGNTIELTADVTIDAPFLITATTLDSVLDNEERLYKEYNRSRIRVSREIKKAGVKIGGVLKVVTHPENIGKISLIYFASVVGGPLGSALVNVLYDKFVLSQDMSDEDMLEKFAIGAAAGYAAQKVPSWLGGEASPDAAQYSDYISKASSSVTQNLVTDVGYVTLDNDSYSSKDFFKSFDWRIGRGGNGG